MKRPKKYLQEVVFNEPDIKINREVHVSPVLFVTKHGKVYSGGRLPRKLKKALNS